MALHVLTHRSIHFLKPNSCPPSLTTTGYTLLHSSPFLEKLPLAPPINLLLGFSILSSQHFISLAYYTTRKGIDGQGAPKSHQHVKIYKLVYWLQFALWICLEFGNT